MEVSAASEANEAAEVIFGEGSSVLSLLFYLRLYDLPLFFLVVRASTFWCKSTWTVRLRA